MIEISINSVIDLVDFVVVVDGAYIGLEDHHDHSWDGTAEIVKQLVGKKGVVIQPSARSSEPRLRDEYLRFVWRHMPESWVFIIDSDEVLCDAKEDFEWIRSKEASAYKIGHIFRNDPDPEYGFYLYNSIHERTPFHPRLYGGIAGLHYAENHWALRDAFGDRVEPKYPGVTLFHAWLDHRRTLRSPGYIRTRKYYDYVRWKYERVERPLISYMPRQLLVNADALLNRIRFHPQRYLNYVHRYTIHSIKYHRELSKRQSLSKE